MRHLATATVASRPVAEIPVIALDARRRGDSGGECDGRVLGYRVGFVLSDRDIHDASRRDGDDRRIRLRIAAGTSTSRGDGKCAGRIVCVGHTRGSAAQGWTGGAVPEIHDN